MVLVEDTANGGTADDGIVVVTFESTLETDPVDIFTLESDVDCVLTQTISGKILNDDGTTEDIGQGDWNFIKVKTENDKI